LYFKKEPLVLISRTWATAGELGEAALRADVVGGDDGRLGRAVLRNILISVEADQIRSYRSYTNTVPEIYQYSKYSTSAEAEVYVGAMSFFY
jgi:hypothetical protein